MGQALRRASRRLRPSTPPPPPATHPHPPPPPPRAPAASRGAPQDRLDAPSSDGCEPRKTLSYRGAISMPIVKCTTDVTTQTNAAHGVLEERDPSYDEMLKHMVRRITTKPGGKPEMGEASVVQRYDRPLPKVRTSKSEPGQSGSRQLPPGALNVVSIQEMIQLYQGKSNDHHGPMSVDDIASKFRVEVSIVRNIVQSVSLPQDENVEKKEEY